jgi:hypothetical protein
MQQAWNYASRMSHPRPYYYLENFCTALAWLQQRYGDLLNPTEHAFMERFHVLPRKSAALLVRMVGRKGDLFRTAKLRYPEIGDPTEAAGALIELGWVDCQPIATVVQLDWWPQAPDAIYRLAVKPLCERLRLLYFGNFRQDWSQFVLTELGIFRYEKVSCDTTTRAFQRRDHIDSFDGLFQCRQKLEESDDIGAVLAMLPGPVADNEWLEGRRRKLQFRIAQCLERRKEWAHALEIYRACEYPGSRLRVVRLLERLEQVAAACKLADTIREQPADEVEAQQVGRMWPRLQRKAGLTAHRSRPLQGWTTFALVLPVSGRPARLECATGEALSQPDAPVHYVENGLLNSLFGLLCWEAIFAPVAGAFFHEFQAAPADLHAPEFRVRRASQFAECFAQLQGDGYRDTIRHNFEHKYGILSPFVSWGLLSHELLAVALSCFPREHLRVCFERILADIRANVSGLPDLVQFWPEERRYRLIEVKGPGDRLQDSQLRWLAFCVSHAIPVSVCHVSWHATDASCV